ncbi:expressed protein [Chlorella variabilis]|uniref:Expressed protein n=1 Tax=Chlorella variabilis TaxID=554065 RepID=E1Z5Y9_CHLVA|nr:expressed protein [Chlorella variabilis]EFN58556.1 expressed protein [Chlorella variabilis]|eukprot:XP_005850658.1 expressed protein [Chlorella variabilis]
MSGFQAQDQQRAAAAAILLSPSTLTAFASKEGIPVARAQLKLIKARAGSELAVRRQQPAEQQQSHQAAPAEAPTGSRDVGMDAADPYRF